MKRHLKAVANISIAQLWDYLSKPSMIPVRVGAPPSSAIENIVLSLFQDLDAPKVEECRMRFLRNHKFFQEINDGLTALRHTRTNCGGWPELLYSLIIFSKPQVTIETGVFDGLSSAVILQALHDNDNGILVSVDLPATEAIKGSTDRTRAKTLPPNFQPGWLIPNHLRGRHHLLLGDSKEFLPQAFKEYPQIDFFFHDSLHTYDHQLFEYSIAWPHLSNGGLLLSDDILWSPAFHKFCKDKGKIYKRFEGFGVVRKD